MNGQLTVGDLLKRLAEIKKIYGLTDTELNNLPIYLGDDDELNGIHCAWYVNGIDASNEEDEDIVEMINDRRGNNELIDKGVLIS